MTEYTEQEIAKARELLADVMKGDGSEGAAMWLLAGKPTDIADFHALQAICAALRTASQGDGNSVLVDRGALQLAINVLQRAGKDEVAEALRQATPASASEANALPARDTSRTNEEQGLYRKFDVRRTDGSDALGGKHHGCEYFVLDLTHDPFSKAAALAYADAAEATHPDLASDMRERYGLTAPASGEGQQE